MKSHLDFHSTAFPPLPDENPEKFGKALADYLASRLTDHGFRSASIAPEDWGWLINVDWDGPKLWIGCANYDGSQNSFLCFVEQRRSLLDRLLDRNEASDAIERTAEAIYGILDQSGMAGRFRWWTEAELAGDYR